MKERTRVMYCPRAVLMVNEINVLVRICLLKSAQDYIYNYFYMLEGTAQFLFFKVCNLMCHFTACMHKHEFKPKIWLQKSHTTVDLNVGASRYMLMMLLFRSDFSADQQRPWSPHYWRGTYWSPWNRWWFRCFIWAERWGPPSKRWWPWGEVSKFLLWTFI